MNAARRTGGPDNIDYSLGQIDTKLQVIAQTLSEDRLSDAQFRTWVRDKIEKLEAQSNSAAGQAQTWRSVWGFVQLAIGAVGGILAASFERWLHKGP